MRTAYSTIASLSLLVSHGIEGLAIGHGTSERQRSQDWDMRTGLKKLYCICTSLPLAYCIQLPYLILLTHACLCISMSGVFLELQGMMDSQVQAQAHIHRLGISNMLL